jgi:hypothetical protein
VNTNDTVQPAVTLRVEVGAWDIFSYQHTTYVGPGVVVPRRGDTIFVTADLDLSARDLHEFSGISSADFGIGEWGATVDQVEHGFTPGPDGLFHTDKITVTARLDNLDRFRGHSETQARVFIECVRRLGSTVNLTGPNDA